MTIKKLIDGYFETFEPLDIVEAAMDNDNTAYGKLVTNLTNKVEGNIVEDKTKRHKLPHNISRLLH